MAAPLPPLCDAGIARGVLMSGGWLRRTISVRTREGIFQVEYDGWGMGYESVRVNGVEADRRGGHLWFAPRFEFALGSSRAEVEVHVGPTCQIRALILRVDGLLAYAE